MIGEPARLVAVAVLLAGDGERRLERGLGELREGLADGRHLGERVGGSEVERGDAQQSAPVGDAQGVVRRRGPRARRSRRATSSLRTCSPGAALGPGGVDPVLRVSDELVDERGRRPEHAEDPLPPDARRRELGREGRRSPQSGASPRRPSASATRTSPSRHWSGSAVSPMTAARSSSWPSATAARTGSSARSSSEPDGPVGVGEAEPGEGPFGGPGA